MKLGFSDLGVEIAGFVATVEMRRPPDNHFDNVMIHQLAETYEALDRRDDCRARQGHRPGFDSRRSDVYRIAA